MRSCSDLLTVVYKKESAMRVILVVEYKGVPADGEQADQIVEEIGEACESIQKDFGATSCFIDDVEWD